MPGSFFERTELLSEFVGHGEIAVTVSNDAHREDEAVSYAFNIHESHWENWFNPNTMRHEGFKTLRQHTGEPKFLTRALYQKYLEVLEGVAAGTLEGGIHPAMVEGGQEIIRDAQGRTPVRTGNLRDSYHVEVEG